jgi:hypothetical protein
MDTHYSISNKNVEKYALSPSPSAMRQKASADSGGNGLGFKKGSLWPISCEEGFKPAKALRKVALRIQFMYCDLSRINIVERVDISILI